MIALLFVASVTTQADPYSPLAIDADSTARTIELDVEDKTRSRQIPLRIYLPQANAKPLAVILFSHGLGGSNRGNVYMGNHWAGRGYVAVFVQHQLRAIKRLSETGWVFGIPRNVNV